ncbi:MAG: type I restriction enzyme HsdR N-terminal domain-containing protein [Bacteroidota bacterium]
MGNSFPTLALPPIDARLRTVGDRDHILCLIRRRFVALTPEEWVRQHLLGYLTGHRAYPASLVAVEKSYPYQGMGWRADIVAYGRNGAPLVLIECKAPGVPIGQRTFDQVSRYNLVVAARVAVVSNGLEHYCFAPNRDTGAVTFLDDIPSFDTLSG